MGTVGAKSKLTDELLNKVCKLIEKDTYTIEEICKQVGISHTTYFEWKNTKPEFVDAIKKAEQKALEQYKVEARKSLKKLVKGFTITNTKKVMRKGQLVEVIEEVKHIEPNTAAVIFTLTNTDPDNFKNKQFNDNLNKNINANLPELTKEQIDKVVESL